MVERKKAVVNKIRKSTKTLWDDHDDDVVVSVCPYFMYTLCCNFTKRSGMCLHSIHKDETAFYVVVEHIF